MAEQKSGIQDVRVNQLLLAVADRRPHLAHVLQQYGSSTLGEYASIRRELDEQASELPTLQDPQDVVNAATLHAARLLGPEVAGKLSQRLTDRRSIITANHHAPDYFPITVQGNLLGAMLEEPGGVLPIFADGTIPMGNVVYPRGPMLTRRDREGRLIRVPVFGRDAKSSMVSSMAPYDGQMVQAALERLGGINGSGAISRQEYLAMRNTLQYGYNNPTTVALPRYSDQITPINSWIWRKMMHKDIAASMPELVFINMEDVGTEVLLSDLEDPDSLSYQMLFDPYLHEALLSNLNGVPLCWGEDGGTEFFWGVDDEGAAVSLRSNEERTALVGEGVAIPMRPDALQEALSSGQVIPSGFTEFGTFAFSRGFTCYGGFMQVDYLTRMRDGLAQSLSDTGRSEMADIVAQVPTANYSTGMTMAVASYDDGTVVPAGSLEMIARGGLTSDDLDRIRDCTVAEGNLVGLPGMYDIIYGEDQRDAALSSLTVKDLSEKLGDKLVKINL
jgi:hypothetical protein